jgi:hypothetical protein
LYGHVDEAEEDAHALPLLAAASYLELQDLAESCVNSLLRNLTTTGIRDIVTFVTSSYYGPLTDRLLESAKALLYRDGWEMDFANGWDGISGEFAAEIIGYDGFYCPNEYARYCFVRDLINFRLKQSYSEPTSPVGGEFMKIPTASTAASIVDSDAVTVYADSTDDAAAGDEDPDIKPLRLLLENGIYFCHIDFAELQSIAEDLDFFGRPMVKESTIRDALWQQMQLRQKVLSCPNDSPELGISKTEFVPSNAAKKALTQNEAAPANANDRLGVSTNSPKKSISLNTTVATLCPKPSLSRLDQIFSCGRPARRYVIPSEDSSTTVIGDCPEPPTRRAASPAEGTKTTIETAAESGEDVRFSEFPPFRFSVEFKSTASLKERKRVYSKTVFYAGSFWNIYIQKVVKGTKSVQLGVYLHRAKDKEGTGSQSASAAQVSRDTELLMQGGAKGDSTETSESTLLDATAGDLSRAATPRGPASTLDPALGFYEDTRPMIQTYFKIFSPSRKGKMLSMFSSRPDGFNFSQSWGWKSSSLILDEQERGEAGDRGTLRFMVVLGMFSHFPMVMSDYT